MAMMNWHIVTSAEYAVGVKVDDDLYFLSDTHEIYRGNESYTQSITMYTELPASGALNRLYINSTTLEGKIWNGTNWADVLKPIASTISPDGTSPVSGAAVAQYVSAQLQTAIANENVVKNLSYDSAEKLITVTKGDDSSTTLVLNGLGCSLSYSNGNLQLLDHSGATVGDPINLGTERFVQGGAYDEETQTIVLWFDDAEDADSATDKIEIPVGDLVDTYSVQNTATVNLTLLANTISAAVNISAEPGNAIQAKADGIYAPSVDTTGLMNRYTYRLRVIFPLLVQMVLWLILVYLWIVLAPVPLCSRVLVSPKLSVKLFPRRVTFALFLSRLVLLISILALLISTTVKPGLPVMVM